MPGPQISRQKIEAAAQGDHVALREVLTQIFQTTDQQQNVTGTVAKHNTTAGQVNPAASVPPQATGSFSVLSGTYVVQLVNPGGTSSVSQLQAQQQAGSATPLTPLQPVRPIYHQIRASTSPAFNVNSNTKLFGGDTGQVQTYWPLTGLGSGTWFIQFRSSYDGVNWNKWRNANGGTGLGGLVNQVTVEDAGNSDWALFTMPGSLTAGVGVGEVSDETIFDLPLSVPLYSSGMIAIAGPDGFSGQGNAISGFDLCDVDLQTPSTPAAGIPDYPVEIRMRYAIAQTESDFPANAGVFAIAFDPTNTAVKLYTEPAGGGNATWVVLRLPGGAKIAIGQGTNTDGDTVWTPALSWISGTRMFAGVALTDAPLNQQPITGVNAAAIDATFKLSASYMDTAGNPVAGQKAHWMAVCWQQGAPVETHGTVTYVRINLQGGHAIVLGGGNVANGTTITLPTGFTANNILGIALPASSTNSGHHLRGIQECALIGDFASLVYTDNTNIWNGNMNLLLAAWK